MKLSNTHPALRRAWHVVARSDEVGRDPVRVLLLGEPWALVRLPAGDGTMTLAAFADECPHRLAPLSAGSVDGNTLRCAYHGWCFRADGACTEIPSLEIADRVPPRARARVPAALTERAGLIFLAPESPVTDLIDVSIADDPTYMHGMLEPSRAHVGAGLMIDNFLDLAHFPFVHGATIGAEEATVVGDLEIERAGFAMTVRNRHWFPNHEDLGVVTGERSLLQERALVYEYQAPFAVSLRIDYVQAGGTMVLHFFAQPEDDDHCRLYTLVHRNDLAGDPHLLAESLAYETKILDEDLKLQERYVDHDLPLDVTTEVHVRADRHTVEYRRILSDLVAGATSVKS